MLSLVPPLIIQPEIQYVIGTKSSKKALKCFHVEYICIWRSFSRTDALELVEEAGFMIKNFKE